MKRAGLIAVTAGTLVLALGGLAQASSGAFTTAFATPDWAYARFSGTGQATPCPSVGACSFTPTVIAVPSLPEYGTCDEVVLDSDPNTMTSWTGGSYSANTTFAFDVAHAPILHGVYGQRLCLMVFGNREIIDVVCEVQREVLEEFDGKPRPPCALRKVVFEERLASTLLSVEPPPAAPPSTTQTPSPPPAKAKKGRRCPPGKHRVRRSGKTRCTKSHRTKRHAPR